MFGTLPLLGAHVVNGDFTAAHVRFVEEVVGQALVVLVGVVSYVGSLSGWIVGPPGLSAPSQTSAPGHNGVGWTEGGGLGLDLLLYSPKPDLPAPPRPSAHGHHGVRSCLGAAGEDEDVVARGLLRLDGVGWTAHVNPLSKSLQVL